jgi:hypothetical protein
MDQCRPVGTRIAGLELLWMIGLLLLGTPVYFLICLVAITVGFLRLGVLWVLRCPCCGSPYRTKRDRT